MNLRTILLSATALAVFSTLPSFADVDLVISGDMQFTKTSISFGQYPNGAPYTPAPGYGTFQVSAIPAGDFQTAGVTVGEFGNIQSIGALGFDPSPTPGSSLPFMTFDSGGSNLQLYATSIGSGNEGYFVATNFPTGASVSFNIQGFVYDTSTFSQIDTFQFIGSAQFAGVTADQLFSGPPVDSPFSGIFTLSPISTTPTPEPSSLVFLGTGCVGLLTTVRRRRAA